jgi:hypothetical protein
MNRHRVTAFLLSIVVLVIVGIGTAKAQELQPPAQIAGNWTIYAYNVDQPGSSLKTVQLTQNGNILSGYFRGPHQRGKLQGWISGNHVEFSTDTRDVLTFRGQVTPQGMSGLYGIHGRHAPWNAERSSNQVTH